MGSVPQSAGPAAVQFGKYWLDAELAVGGMARLYRARLRGPGGFEKKLVVKQILPQLAGNPSFVELLVREANTLVQMSHPNIVPIYELGVVDGVYFLAMELVEGATIAELLGDGPLPPALCAHAAAQVCDALHYAHERFGLVHRDVTPRNIIVDRDGHVKLLDFGIAAPLALTGQGERFGSPGYMSPEQARGDALGARSDLFSLGVVLHEALTGTRPGRAAPSGDAGMDAELAALIGGLLAPEPQQRPDSAAAAALVLRRVLARSHTHDAPALLGKRVERARVRSAAEPEGSKPAPASAAGSGGGVTRSIATHHELGQMLAASTERLAAVPTPSHAPTATSRRARTAGVLLLGAVLLSAAAAAVAFWAGGDARPGIAATGAGARPEASPAASAAPPRATPLPAEPPATGPGPELAPEPSTSRAGSSAPLGARREPAAGRAYVTINALPWAEIRLGDRLLGSTPQRSLPLSAGEHALLLSCPPLGRSARVPLRLAAGGRYQVLVDLQQNPPRVTLR